MGIGKYLIIRFCLGGLQSVRFTFVTADNGWNPSEDAYAAFNREKPNSLFIDGSWVEYSSENEDYTWNVIKHERNRLKFTGRSSFIILYISIQSFFHLYISLIINCFIL